MKNVKVIEPAKSAKRRLRVAAYCRVSTSQAKQLDSLKNQRQHYENCIKSRKDWQYVGIYYDKGITGTSVSRREGFCRMMQDAREGRMDLILVKSVSRFARNTVDCLESIRELARHQVYIVFEQEQIDTGRLEDEFMLTIFSALAENESASLSDNVKWGIRQSFRRGTYRSSISPYGYKFQDGRFIVQPEEATVVQEIFALAVAGCGPYIITNTINSKGLRTRKGKKWHVNSIKFILQNETYTGDVLYQKSFNDERYQNRSNNGELPMYYHRNHHKAIVSREIFFRTRLEYQKRAVKTNTVGRGVKAGRY